MLKNITVLVGLILAILVLPVAAENKKQDLQLILDLPLAELMELDVTTPSRTTQKISDAPGTIIVVTRQQIQERGYINLLDLLQDLPQVDVNQKSIEEHFNQVAIRGVNGNNKFIILRNGIRISSPTGEHIPISDNFPLFHAKQVEIAYGPVSALYGADAFTGVINIITKKPEDFDGVEIASHFGTDDYYYNYLNFSKPLNDHIDLSFGGHWNSSENPDLSNSYPEFFQNENLLDLNDNVVRSANQREPFTAATKSYSNYAELVFKKKLTLGMTQSFMRHPTTIGVRPEKAIFGKEAIWETKIETYHGKYKFNLSEQLISETLFNYSRYQTLPDTKFTNNFAGFSGFKYALGEEYKFEQLFNFKLDKFHEFVGGITYENFYSIPKTQDLPSRYDTDKDPKEQNLFHIGTNDSLPIEIHDDEYNNVGFYIQAQSKWKDWISTSLGLRVDIDSRFGSTVNPRLETTLRPRSATTIKLLYGEAFLAPSPNNTFAFFGSFLGTQDGQGRFESNFFTIPNPDLRPEISKTVEINWTEQLNPDLQFNSSSYYTVVLHF
ncbi:hypothetical protein UR09_01800 [Candidatus Nitromaritima sp. SCGC AAA799-A02]|nr:hypothetical protein UR09_01800 [Candidatus Nitromaritima sp. SCGC AAA799-A02]